MGPKGRVLSNFGNFATFKPRMRQYSSFMRSRRSDTETRPGYESAATRGEP